jgi:hypothetical protein
VTAKNLDGRPTVIELDTTQNTKFSKLPASELKSAIAQEYKMNPSSIKGKCCSGRLFELHFNPSKSADIKSLQFIKAGNLPANSGQIGSAIMSRSLGKFWGVGTLWHPLERSKLAATGKAGQRATQLKQAEEKRRQQRIYERNSSEVKSTAGKINRAVGGRTAATVLLITGTMCAIRDVAGDVITLNHLAIVLPAMNQAADSIAIGSQIQAGKDFDAEQIGPIADGFKDPKTGQTIWQGKALQILTTGKDTGGADLSSNYVQAFSNNTTADKIRDFINSKLPLHAGVIVCSTPGKIIQIGLGVAAIAFSFESGGLTAQAFWALRITAGAAATAGAIYLISDFTKDLIKDKAVVPQLMSGPLGGNLLAYGARAASNTTAIASGGAELTGSITSAYDDKYQQRDGQEFQKKNLAQKVFDVNDYHSVASKLIDSSSSNPLDNVSKVASLFTHFPRYLANIFHFSFLPKAQAAPKPYNWGFPRYGIPESVASYAAYQDPYDNAEVAVSLLKNSSSYRSRVENCFGQEINTDDWSLSPIEGKDINPNEDSYIKAHCNENSDAWHRIQLFVFDSRLTDAQACYDGDDESCINLGFDSSPLNRPSSPTEVPKGSAADLAQKILNLEANHKISFTTSLAKQAIVDTSNGQPAKIESRCNTGKSTASLNPVLLGSIITIAQSHTLGLGYFTNGCHTAGSAHYDGRAVDINLVDGRKSTGGSRDRPFMHEITGVLPDGSGMGQVQCSPIKINPIHNVSLFADSCNHIHIQVPAGNP